jgi:hypothetical protein
MEFKRRGKCVMPKVPVDVTFNCTISTPMYENNQKKYIDLHLPESVKKRIETVHNYTNDYITKRFMNPLQGTILKVKVPFKYGRVTCEVGGIKPLQEMQEGDSVFVTVNFCGVWEFGDFCGLSWKLDSIV